VDTRIFCLCAFQNRFFHKVKKAARLLTNSPYPSSRIASPPFSLLPLQNFDLQGHYSITQPVNNQQKNHRNSTKITVVSWCECSYRIWQNTVLPVAEHHIQTIIRTFAIFLCFSYNELTEIKEVQI